mgnify:CR=1 FL=1
MNTVVGLIHKYYGDALIRSVFDAWDGDLRQTMLDDMTWLYLENAAYRLELAPPPGSGSAAPCPCRLFLCDSIQALPSGVDG